MIQAMPVTWKERLRPFTRATLAAVVLFAILLAGVGCWTQSVQKCPVTHPVLTLAEFEAYVKAGRVPLLDARSAQSYAAGHVPGAFNLPPGSSFEAGYQGLEKILSPYKDRLVIVYCGDMWCSLADELQTQLIACGFQHVARFPGGWQEWRQAK
jgi:rhodanese-related sulfurtransferase